MKQIKFDSFDLNLLRVFDAVMKERSVAAAADRLALTPSAISHSLMRLRALLNDELFVRSAHAMHPTQRAEQIGTRLHDLLVQLHMALMPADFLPAEAEHRFVIKCGLYVSAVFLPKFTSQLRSEAPKSTLTIRPIGNDPADDLDSGRADLVIGSFGHLPDRFAAEDLFTDRLVWVMSRKHPMASGPLTLERLAAIPHLISTAAADNPQGPDSTIVSHGLELLVPLNDHRALEIALARQGLSRNVAVMVPGTLTALSILRDSDMAALVPRRHALAEARVHQLELFEPPYDSPAINIKAVWHREFGDQPALVWLRKLVESVAATLSSADATS
jgi:DNA-binding transcriptional LysR family regulator